MHIPLPEVRPLSCLTCQYLDLWNTKATIGKLKDKGVCCSSVNTGLFTALKDNGVRAVFAGHDHDNDFVGEYEGVTLAYGRKTGHGAPAVCPCLPTLFPTD